MEARTYINPHVSCVPLFSMFVSTPTLNSTNKPRQRGGCEILRHTAGYELRRRHEPPTHEALQVRLRNLKRGLVLFRHGLRGQEKQRSIMPKQTPLSLSLFKHREGGEEAMGIHARGHRGALGQPSTFIAPRCDKRGGKSMGPYKVQ
jgi:hypothetical protein